MDRDGIRDRAAGAVVGAFIGDALGLGPHWYYDLDRMRADYGPWIDGYTDPGPGRYHAGLKAGDLSQTGLITLELLRSVAERDGYDERDFANRLDEQFLQKMDGAAYSGPGGYTNQSIRDLYRARVKEGKPWGRTGDYADTTEGAERAVVIAARYALSPSEGARMIARNIGLTQIDPYVKSLSTAYCVIVSALIRGEPFDDALAGKLYSMVEKAELPFSHVELAEKKGTHDQEPKAAFGLLPSPDGLLFPSHIRAAAKDPEVTIEPAWKVSLVYGMPCSIVCVLPAAYYLGARFHEDFEQAVLHAVNGGGQNMSRAMLTGALVGAQAGLSNIPARFIEGLSNGREIVSLARRLVP
ncbi:MAG: ADP-ribosylglycohydrolase family protein [Syntrophobacteraceae bacterium]|nr:ADP-ribosylglycohydrolase family protein [Syntrophobacteraceae bacterium]